MAFTDMGHKTRIEFAGAIFHLWFRRVDHWPLFLTDEDCAHYVALLDEAAKRFGLVVVEFCLMPNHVHLLVQISKPNLGAALHFIHTNYVRHYNVRHNRQGRLFERRPQWKAVTDDIYLATVRQYIAANPVRARLCDHPEEWLWSSRGLAAHRGRPLWTSDANKT